MQEKVLWKICEESRKKTGPFSCNYYLLVVVEEKKIQQAKKILKIKRYLCKNATVLVIWRGFLGKKKVLVSRVAAYFSEENWKNF